MSGRRERREKEFEVSSELEHKVSTRSSSIPLVQLRKLSRRVSTTNHWISILD